MKQVVYISNAKSKQIHVWRINEQGKLTFLQNLTVPGEVQPMKISQDGNHLYVGIRPNSAIITYLIAVDGTLIQEKITDLPGIPTHIEIDKYNRLLFIPSYHQGNLSVLPINQYGIPEPAIQVINDLKNPHGSIVSFDNLHLFVSCLGEDYIRIYTISNDGYLNEKIANRLFTKNGSGPRHLIFSPNQATLYCLNELNATIILYSAFEPYKKLKIYNILPNELKCNPWASDIHITKNGKYLYASERSTSIIRHFKIINNGFELLPMDYYITEYQPRSFTIDQTNNFLIVAGQKSNHVIVYKIHKITGVLQALDRYKVGNEPSWITTHLIQ
ncbi:6-phosphogluconolactonase [Candidatus Arsenophonus lipoptenae]|uniref:6-phosphogluconolactonase n=1 Tax=Candidatus Arsenophonus lipoptenae TaxID=634113 RepID=A0A0X9WAE5_9GAMM|nr:6-phosphogluconolactonase [Candidatus Arsenophonus lipoptenae]AMA64853.1 6-phosphogluconolactonase [Candidatus Arsenophonus lipoptenae]